mmetsp:Transcript_2142/g.3190  ORF Transcript_2142/g.3190 Transcript_2142/m.3190 type:complete len:648 (-) Transcript_2142:111-2054(-)
MLKFSSITIALICTLSPQRLHGFQLSHLTTTFRKHHHLHHSIYKLQQRNSYYHHHHHQLHQSTNSNVEEEDLSNVEFPPPLTPTERTIRAVTFWSRAIPILARYKLLETKIDLQTQILGRECVSDEECELLYDEIHEWGSERLSDTIQELKGFYVKTGQVMSTRVDLFPEQYTSKLRVLQDGLDPMGGDVVRATVEQELLRGDKLGTLFASFEDEPLGAASIAQVHKATLHDGRVVAVKVQRPNMEPKLRGDVANLKAFSKKFGTALPVDYYTVFSELEAALDYELDFLHEAQAMEKINAAISHTVPDYEPAAPSLTVPMPIPGLSSRRVLVMDFVSGVPLSQLKEEMERRGLGDDEDTKRLLGDKILDSLSEAFARMTFGTGFIHGDPHPGNVFVQEGGKVALIDCGQCKQLRKPQQLALATLIPLIAGYQRGDPSITIQKIASAVREFGVEFSTPDEYLPIPTPSDATPDELLRITSTNQQREQSRLLDEDNCAASVALLLFGDTGLALPGGYASNELSPDSPIKRVTSFPQEFVLLGRAAVLLKGIAKALDVEFSLAGQWESTANRVLSLQDSNTGGVVPVYSRADGTNPKKGDDRVRFTDVKRFVKTWGKEKGKDVIVKAVGPAKAAKLANKVRDIKNKKKSD